MFNWSLAYPICYFDFKNFGDSAIPPLYKIIKERSNMELIIIVIFQLPVKLYINELKKSLKVRPNNTKHQ
jgi:hypothetical protein